MNFDCRIRKLSFLCKKLWKNVLKVKVTTSVILISLLRFYNKFSCVRLEDLFHFLNVGTFNKLTNLFVCLNNEKGRHSLYLPKLAKTFELVNINGDENDFSLVRFLEFLKLRFQELARTTPSCCEIK